MMEMFLLLCLKTDLQLLISAELSTYEGSVSGSSYSNQSPRDTEIRMEIAPIFKWFIANLYTHFNLSFKSITFLCVQRERKSLLDVLFEGVSNGRSINYTWFYLQPQFIILM